MNELKIIPIEKLHHHPKNPRQELGDLTELAESIRARGILQNLTVVPREMTAAEYKAACEAYRAEPSAELQRLVNRHIVPGEYWVVIGNRRMEAAKIAGLAGLPCIESDMTEREQMATMVLENMQRSDLTCRSDGLFACRVQNAGIHCGLRVL